MSHIALPVSNNPLASESLTGDNSVASFADAGNIFFLSNDSGGDLVSNYDNGIFTTGTGTDVFRIGLNVFRQDQTTTTGLETKVGSFFGLGTIEGTFYVYGNIEVFDSSLPAGATFAFTGCARTTGTLAPTITIVGSSIESNFLDTVLTGIDIEIVSQGGFLVINITGVAGSNLNWNIITWLRFVRAGFQ